MANAQAVGILPQNLAYHSLPRVMEVCPCSNTVRTPLAAVPCKTGVIPLALNPLRLPPAPPPSRDPRATQHDLCTSLETKYHSMLFACHISALGVIHTFWALIRGLRACIRGSHCACGCCNSCFRRHGSRGCGSCGGRAVSQIAFLHFRSLPLEAPCAKPVYSVHVWFRQSPARQCSRNSRSPAHRSHFASITLLATKGSQRLLPTIRRFDRHPATS